LITDNPRKPTDEPWFPRPPYFEYTLTFSTVGKAAVTASLNGNAGDVLLDPGTWTLNIIGTYSGETVAESAPVTVTVPDNGDLVSVSVTVHPVLNGAKGTFNSSNIFYSEGLTNVSVVLTPLDVGSAEQSEIVLTYGQTISLAPGYYRLSIRAMKGNQLLIRREIVHIYSYTRTEKTYLLTEADFAPAVYLGGTLTGGIEGYSPTMVIVYEDADCRVDIGQGAVSGDAWSMEAEGTRETLYFKVQLTKDAAGGDHTRVYYSKLIEVIGISTAGKMDMVLLIEAYTVTFDANGGLFEDGETVITMTAPENETLTLPSAPRGERAFTGWYDVGRLFTAETRVNGDIVLYAGWLLELGDIADYLANAQGGATADDPVQLTLSPDLANKGWETVLSAVHASDKYVTLDLSGAVMTGTEFAPGYAAAGVTKIVALILPDAAKSINTTFNAFTALGSIIGASVEAVGGYAFSGCAALTSVSLPAADSIGGYAFSGCTALTSVSLPAATSIGDYAFSGTALTSVSLPAATSIGREAFSGTALTSVSLPAATSIGDYAFSDYERRQYCTALESVSLPKATSIGERAFYG
jgi:hypothetical protein